MSSKQKYINKKLKSNPKSNKDKSNELIFISRDRVSGAYITNQRYCGSWIGSSIKKRVCETTWVGKVLERPLPNELWIWEAFAFTGEDYRWSIS